MSSSTNPPPPLRERTRTIPNQVDGASEGAHQAPDIADGLSKVAPAEPPSSTAICRVGYSFETFPDIHVIPIRVTSSTSLESEFRPIYSKRLRKLAIESFVKAQIPDLEKKFALMFADEGYSTSAEYGLVDRILVLNCDMVSISEPALHDLNKKGRILVPTVSKRIRNETTSEAVYCHVETPESHVVGTEKYWKMLKLLVREITSQSVPQYGLLSDCKEILFEGTVGDSESPTKSNIGSNTSTSSASDWASFSSLKSQDELVIQEADIFKVLFRSKVKIDSVQRSLQLEFDLVPGLDPGVRLSDLIIRVLGPGVLTASGDANLSIMRSILVGLHVDRDPSAAIPTVVLTQGTANGQDHSSGDLTKPSPRNSTVVTPGGPVSLHSTVDENASVKSLPWVVRQVKLPGEVPSFRVGGKNFSVHKYFTTKLERRLEYPSLPLAEIARDTWVPLETLVTSGTQMISDRKLTRILMKRVRMASGSDTHNEYLAKEVANAIIEPLNGYLEYDDKLKVPVSTFERLTPQAAKKSAKPKATPSLNNRTLLNPDQSTKLKLGILYIKANGGKRDCSVDFDMIIENIKASVKGIDPGFKIFFASIADTKPLLLPPNFGGSTELQTLFKAKPNTIFAVIDSAGRSASELRNIRTDLQKFGNRKVGAVTYCMTEKNLKESLEANAKKANYFPQKILDALRVMHGHPLFTTNVLEGIDQTKPSMIMIVGAHISHPEIGSAEHCPSVAAVVASLDEQMTRYPGSVRLQPTYKAAERRGKHLKRITESQILDLEDMMTERLEAWKRHQSDAVPKAIFYRDSIGFLDDATISKEKDAISAAMSTVFPGEITSLTYIVVNKCRDSPYNTLWERCIEAEGVDHFSASDPEASKKGRRYQYFVAPETDTLPRVQLDVPSLERFTKNSNTSFQLDKRVAIALPVHYARKLARHTFNYFRFAVTNQYDIVPSVSRRLNGSNEEVEANGKEMMKMMREYLFSDSSRANSNLAPPFGRTNPWLEELDDKMFYL